MKIVKLLAFLVGGVLFSESGFCMENDDQFIEGDSSLQNIGVPFSIPGSKFLEIKNPDVLPVPKLDNPVELCKIKVDSVFKKSLNDQYHDLLQNHGINVNSSNVFNVVKSVSEKTYQGDVSSKGRNLLLRTACSQSLYDLSRNLLKIADLLSPEGYKVPKGELVDLLKDDGVKPPERISDEEFQTDNDI